MKKQLGKRDERDCPVDDFGCGHVESDQGTDEKYDGQNE